MVWYRCSKCGREVEMPEGDYVCKICLTPLEPEKEKERKEREYRQLIEGKEKPIRPRTALGRFVPTRCAVCGNVGADEPIWDMGWSVSDEEWLRIVPEKWQNKTICPWCFVKFAEQKGEKYKVRFFKGSAQGVSKEGEELRKWQKEALLQQRIDTVKEYANSVINKLSKQFNVKPPDLKIAPLRTEYVDKWKAIIISIIFCDFWEWSEVTARKLTDWVTAHEFTHYIQDLEGRLRPKGLFSYYNLEEMEKEADKFAEEYTGIPPDEANEISQILIAQMGEAREKGEFISVFDLYEDEYE